MAAKGKKIKGSGTFLDRLGGDKVVWIIVLCLVMVSLVSIFSSTSLLATQQNVSRLSIAKGQLLTALGGLLIVYLFYKIGNAKLFRFVSRFGFAASLLLLVLLVALSKLQPHGVEVPFVRAVELNGAYRWLKVFGIQISVYEFVKVFMVMYVAWAVDYLKTARFKWTHNEFVKELVYIYVPVLAACALVLVGGTSSAVFMGGVLLITMLFGGVRFKNVLLVGAAGAVALLGAYGLYRATRYNENPMFKRFATVESRSMDWEERFKQAEPGTEEYYEALDKIRQPYGAKIALKEGGLIGKGPGQSTQKYKVSVIYEDYMFSFIVEEYGLLGGIAVIILYLSLMARGSIIVRNCEKTYEKVLVAGLTVLIVGQAMFHIVINCDLGILTGQTLPLISHGRSSFICFSAAFGMILSLSKKVEKKIEKESADADPLIDLDISEYGV